MIERKIDIEVEITPKELAEEFCNMDADQQAIFLNSIYDNFREWDDSIQMQTQAIVNSKNFKYGAKKIMQIFGEYTK